MLWAKGGEASKVDGVFFNVTGGVEKSYGLRELTHWEPEYPIPFQQKRIDALAHFRAPRGPDELLVSTGGEVWMLRGHNSFTDGRAGQMRILRDREIPSSPYDGEYFAARNEWLFITNGLDRNMKWDGTKVCPVGVFAIPVPPDASRLVMKDLIGSSTSPSGSLFHPSYSLDGDPDTRTYFQYRATFVSSSGHEGAPSAPGRRTYEMLPGSLSPGRVIIKIDSLDPPPDDSDIVWRNIYKMGKDGVYYFWRQVGANENVVYDFEMPLPAGGAATALKEDTIPPPTSKFVGFFRGRGYYVPTTHPSFIFYSRPSLPEELASMNFLDVSSDDGEVITGIVTFSDSLIVMKPSSLWQITALANGNPVLTPLINGVGSVAPRANIVAYNRLIFLNDAGVYHFDGGSVRPLSSDLNKWWKVVDKEYLKNAVGWLDEENRRLFLAVPVSGKPILDTLVVFHYELEAFSIIRGNQFHAATRWMDETVVGVELTDPSVSGGRDYWTGTSNLFLYGLRSGTCTAPDIVLDTGEIVPSGAGEGGKDEPVLSTVDMEACDTKGLVRFGPYSATETGWSANDLMEVAGIDVFFRHTGAGGASRGSDLILTTPKNGLNVRWYKDRDPTPAGHLIMALNQDGVVAVMSENKDLVEVEGWNKLWGLPNTWGGTRHLYQRLRFPETVLCREIEIEFSNVSTLRPFQVDAFVLWRVSKGQESQR